MEKKYKSLINNTKIFAIGNIAAKLSQYLVIALCSYKITTAEFGISDTIIQTCAMLVPIFSADIAEGLFRFSMDKSYSREQVISNSMVINFVGTLIAAIALPIEYLILKDIRLALFITLLTVCELYQTSIKEFIRGLGLTKIYMISGFVNAITQVLFCLLCVYALNLGLAGYIFTIAGAFLFEILFCFWKVNIFQYIKISSVSKLVLRDLLKYSLPLAPNKIMWWIISASDRYFVLLIMGASATGLYSMAAKFPALITIVVGLFFQAWQISAIENSDDAEKDKFYSRIFHLLWSMTGMMTAFVLVFIRLAVKLLVADEYFSSWEYAPFLLVAAAVCAIQSFLGVNYTVAKDSMGILKSTSVAAVCNLGFNFVLIYAMGIQGAAIATLVSYVIVALYRYIDTRKYVTIVINHKIGMVVTYATLVLECTVMALFPNLYMITIPGLIVVILANLTTCKIGLSYAKMFFVKRKRC